MIATRAPEGISALNVARGRIVSVRPDGPSGMDLVLDCAGDEILARITRRSFDELGLHPGTMVYAVVKAVAFRPAGERLPED